MLVSWDKDFNHQRFKSERFKGLSRIGMSCRELDGASRFKANMDGIEFEVGRAS